MNLKRPKKIEKFFDTIIEHMKGFTLAACITITIFSIITAYRYYEYSQKDPHFCIICHVINDSVKEWERSKHRYVTCQQCHQLSIIEKNHLLVAYVLKGKQPLAQSHGREKTWQNCKNCHYDSISQGSKTVSKYYGHARHIFISHIECKACHLGNTHNFVPAEDLCKSCHKDKGVHGLGMEGFACLKCHSFTSNLISHSTVPNEKCTKCHTSILNNNVMSNLSCHTCHKPHSSLETSEETCALKCHSSQIEKGAHAIHIKKGIKCFDCHTPHKWSVGKEKAQRLCSKCHSLKNHKLFIY